MVVLDHEVSRCRHHDQQRHRGEQEQGNGGPVGVHGGGFSRCCGIISVNRPPESWSRAPSQSCLPLGWRPLRSRPRLSPLFRFGPSAVSKRVITRSVNRPCLRRKRCSAGRPPAVPTRARRSCWGCRRIWSCSSCRRAAEPRPLPICSRQPAAAQGSEASSY